MGRGLNTRLIKNVIDFLKVKPASWSELKTLGIADNSLSRILKDYLGYWGLIYYDEKIKKWVWGAHMGPHFKAMVTHFERLKKEK